MNLGFPGLQSKAENRKRRYRRRPALGRPVAMTAAMQPRMPALARQQGNTVELTQALNAMGTPLRT